METPLPTANIDRIVFYFLQIFKSVIGGQDHLAVPACLHINDLSEIVDKMLQIKTSVFFLHRSKYSGIDPI